MKTKKPMCDSIVAALIVVGVFVFVSGLYAVSAALFAAACVMSNMYIYRLHKETKCCP